MNSIKICVIGLGYVGLPFKGDKTKCDKLSYST